MTLILVLSGVALVLATYMSALVLAIMLVSRSAIERRLASSGRTEAARWLDTHGQTAILAASLLRSALRIVFFALVLIDVVGMGENAKLTYPAMLFAGSISVLLLWITTTVLASALARYSAVGLVVGAMPLLRVLDIVCSPLTRGLAFIDEAVRRLTGANLRERDDEAEAELLRSIGETHREGGLDEKSAALLENVVEFSSTDVGEVMTPRTDIDGIELTDDLAEIRAFIVKAGHSRIPVYEENLDHIVGVLYVKDLVQYLGEDASDFRLRPLLRQPIVVPETKPVRELLGDFQRSEVHMAMVIDEYGGTAGLVTIEDVLEEIVGEIHDEHDPDSDAQPALHTIDARTAEVDGRYHIDDLNEELGLSLPEDEEFDTIGGFILSELGRVPVVGETVETPFARFTALVATPTHVKRIGVEILDVTGNGERR